MRKMVIILMFIVLSAALSGCKKSSDMDGIKNLKQQEIFTQSENKYYVFFYREGCSGCEDTKPYIKAYIKALKTGNYEGARPIYGVNLSDEANYTMYVSYSKEGGQGTDGRFFVDGVTKWEDLYIGSTPSLITVYVKDGVKTAQYAAQGKEKITTVLNDQLLTYKK